MRPGLPSPRSNAPSTAEDRLSRWCPAMSHIGQTSHARADILPAVLGLALQAGWRCPARLQVGRLHRGWKHCLGCMCRQETPHCTSVSFERHAANAFQSYVSGALAFSIKRGGVLYGNVDEEGRAVVEVIYEPEQAPFQGRCHDVDSRQMESPALLSILTDLACS